MNLSLIFWMLLAYHAVECFSNMFELIQLNEEYYMPTLIMLFSINGCYGLGVFVYAQIILFMEMNQCLINNPEHKLIYYWIVVEVSAFYLSCFISIIVLIINHVYQSSLKKQNH